jgi:Ion channel
MAINKAEEAGLVAGLQAEVKTIRRPGQFTILLIAILCFLLIPSFFIDDALTGLLASIFLSILLLSVLYVFPRRQFTVAAILAVPALSGRWLLSLHPSTELIMVVALCWAVFLAFAAVVILRHVLAATRVSNDTISGAICCYLLLGVFFAFLYAAVALAYPGSFIIDGKTITANLTSFFYQHEIGRLIYFSFVTLATVGYGDITPLSPPARSLAMLESVAGQFYVAILIARLVSIRYSRWGDDYD